MTEVYVSYARADVESAARLAEGLRLQGLSVWWDADVYKGRRRSSEAAEILKKAPIVVCLWSHAAMGSVRLEKEAVAAKRAGKLFPLAMRDFSWKYCPDDLWSVGNAIPRLQFSEFFFVWISQILRRNLAGEETFATWRDLVAGKTWKSGGQIDFASKTLMQAYRGKAGRLTRSPELSDRLDEYWRARHDLRMTVEKYRKRVRAMRPERQEDQIVLFPAKVRVRQDANVGAQKVKMRVASAGYAQPYVLKPIAPQRPVFEVISSPVRPTIIEAPEGVRFKANPIQNVQKWLTAFARFGRTEDVDVPRLEERQRDAIAEATERAYDARSIADLDAAISSGFAALSVGYVGIGAMAARAPEQRIERKPDDFGSARWLDVRSSSVLDQTETDRFMRMGRFRVENAFLTVVPQLHSSACALNPKGGGTWRDPEQAQNIRLLSRLYVSFGSYLHDPLAAPEVELSPRQRECLQWAAIGKSSRQIGEIFDYDTETVMEHLNSACGKLGVTAQEQAVHEAIRRGLIEPPPKVC